MIENVSLPFVSICTPTFNRRPFIPYIIKCFLSQTYPLERIEWIIIDDGTDSIQDLVADIPQVKYHYYDTKMSLGKKRNLMHDKCKGDIIVYMDDDDYYPPERVSHAVETLQKNPHTLVAGSSAMFIYFKHIQQMYCFGPYGLNHATAATFAFRRKLLDTCRYDETAALAEEKAFLKNWTVPLVQMDPLKTILVFSHIHNTFDKKELLEQSDKYQTSSTLKVDDFIKDVEIYDFFVNRIDKLLNKYDPGTLKYKPDVVEQKREITHKRQQKIEIETAKYKVRQEMEIQYSKKIEEYTSIINKLTNEKKSLQEQNEYLHAKLKEVIQRMKLGK
jgi:glycosyltransferase involved in cell wall biosynthesis|tara:strand:+ start:540 stop:1535 length:996 start_codon:yes stop_codon:yes gene_type:complete